MTTGKDVDIWNMLYRIQHLQIHESELMIQYCVSSGSVFQQDSLMTSSAVKPFILSVKTSQSTIHNNQLKAISSITSLAVD